MLRQELQSFMTIETRWPHWTKIQSNITEAYAKHHRKPEVGPSAARRLDIAPFAIIPESLGEADPASTPLVLFELIQSHEASRHPLYLTKTIHLLAIFLYYHREALFLKPDGQANANWIKQLYAMVLEFYTAMGQSETLTAAEIIEAVKLVFQWNQLFIARVRTHNLITQCVTSATPSFPDFDSLSEKDIQGLDDLKTQAKENLLLGLTACLRIAIAGYAHGYNTMSEKLAAFQLWLRHTSKDLSAEDKTYLAQCCHYYYEQHAADFASFEVKWKENSEENNPFRKDIIHRNLTSLAQELVNDDTNLNAVSIDGFRPRDMDFEYEAESLCCMSYAGGASQVTKMLAPWEELSLLLSYARKVTTKFHFQENQPCPEKILLTYVKDKQGGNIRFTSDSATSQAALASCTGTFGSHGRPSGLAFETLEIYAPPQPKKGCALQ